MSVIKAIWHGPEALLSLSKVIWRRRQALGELIKASCCGFEALLSDSKPLAVVRKG